jgi:hypothetical protein
MARNNSVIRRSAGDREGNVVTASVEKVVANSHSATTAPNQGHLRAVGFYENAGDESAELGGSVGSGRAVYLFDGVIRAGVGMYEAHGEEFVGGVIVGLEEPDDTDPLGSVIAVAVYEHYRYGRVGLGLGGRRYHRRTS